MGAQVGVAMWAPRLAKVRVLRASKGTGWAVGSSGVLTARGVVASLLDGAGDPDTAPRTAEVVLGASPERSFEAEILWHNDVLAMLSISTRGRVTWQTLLRSAAQPMLAQPRPEEVTDVGVLGLPGRAADAGAQSSLEWMLSTAEDAVGTLLPAADAGSRVLEVDRAELSRTAWRHGMSGAVVLRGRPEPMVLGIVHGKSRGRRKVRFEVATLPDARHDAEFRAALESVGATPVVFDMDGVTLKNYVIGDCLDESWRPLTMADVPDAGWFGTRRARTDIAGEPAPYCAFVTRPEGTALAGALDRALAGQGPRFIVVRGPSAAGKSRLVAEVVRAHAGLAGHAVLRPTRMRSILELPERLHPHPALIWMDDLQDYPPTALTHERLRVFLRDHPQTLVVGTLLDPPEVAGTARLIDSGQPERGGGEAGGDPGNGYGDGLGAGFPTASASLSGVQTSIDDEALTAVVGLQATPRWIRPRADSDPATWALARATKQGLGLGEYLSGYHELADHYTAADWPTRALVDLAADWDRSGIGETLRLETARVLWERLLPGQLPRDDLRRFVRMTPVEVERLWRRSLEYARETLVGTASLVRTVPGDGGEGGAGGLVASEFARVHIDRGAISGQVWDYLLQEHSTTPVQRMSLGLRALGSGTPQRALRAFESILFFRDDDAPDAAEMRLVEVVARRGIALYHTRTGRDEQAIMVYTDLVDTFGADTDADVAEQVAQALLGIGLTFSKLGSHGQAVSAYTELVDRYRDHPSPILVGYVAKALLGQATTLAELGRHDEERAAYTDIVTRYGDDVVPAMQAIVEVARRALGGA